MVWISCRDVPNGIGRFPPEERPVDAAVATAERPVMQ